MLAALLLAISAWTAQHPGTDASLRGISAPDTRTAWITGTNGTVMRTSDGGASWRRIPVPGAESLDFRGVHALDARTAVILSSGPGGQSRIYRTVDRGAHWSLAHQNSDAQGFFDCMAFWDKKRGILVGDPVDGRFTILRTIDGGRTWTRIARAHTPPARQGEGAFAASGTCLAVARGGRAWFGTGGENGGRVFRSDDWGLSWTGVATPIRHDSASAGIFSIAMDGEGRGIAVGGDYRNPAESRGNIIVTSDGGRTWTAPNGPPPAGYRSAVALVAGRKPLAVAVGTTGTDVSDDFGRTWRAVGTESLNALAFAQSLAFAAGPKGAVFTRAFE